jgi:hypothetical protein
MFFFPPETKLGSKIMRKILNFASFEAKKFSPCFASKQKLLNRSGAKNLKRKKAKKVKKAEKLKKAKKGEKKAKRYT